MSGDKQPDYTTAIVTAAIVIAGAAVLCVAMLSGNKDIAGWILMAIAFCVFMVMA